MHAGSQGIIKLVHLIVDGKYYLQIGGDAHDIFVFRRDDDWNVCSSIAHLPEYTKITRPG